MISREEAVDAERGFWERKTEPWFAVCVVERRVVRRVRNCAKKEY